MENEGTVCVAVIKVPGKSAEYLCDVVREEFPHVILCMRAEEEKPELAVGEQIAIIERRLGQVLARSGKVASFSEGCIAVQIEPGIGLRAERDPRLTDCQLPAMYRPISEDGHFGGWRGAIIVRHSPARLHLQIEEGHVVPVQTELMFCPIGAESASSGRALGEDGGMVNASDARSRRIRVRAITHDVVPSAVPGTVTLVLDISRTLYRAA